MKILENKEEIVYGQKKCPFCSCVFLIEPEDKEKIKYKLGMKHIIYFIHCPECEEHIFLTNNKNDLDKDSGQKKVCLECGKTFDLGNCKIEKWKEEIWEPFFVYIACGRCVSCPCCKKKTKIF